LSFNFDSLEFCQ